MQNNQQENILEEIYQTRYEKLDQIIIEKTKQNKTTISNNLKNSMMSFRDLLKSGTNPTLQSN